MAHPKPFNFKALLRKDGTLNAHGPRGRHRIFSDTYHYFLGLSWARFLGHIVAIYFLTNLLFGVLYFIDGVDALGDGNATGIARFKHCFFLSVESMSAIDYGRVQPASMPTYILMTCQALLGILTLATITGLFYARFARPTARLIFSNKAIIGTHNGRPCFYFRVANERLNQIAEARMTLTLTRNEVSHEGEHFRRFYELQLERDYSPLFALSWTVRHVINENSFLFGMDEKKMRESQTGIVASLSGLDETVSQPIVARHTYSADDIVYNKRFKDILVWHDKKVHIDLKGIHDVHEIEIKGIGQAAD